MFSAAKHIDHYIHDILDYTILSDEHKRLNQDLHTFDICDSIDEVIEIQEDKITMKQIEVKAIYSGFDVGHLVNTDKKRFQQVFLNLLSNAVKFTDRDGSIMVLIELVHDHQVRVSVTDTGRGIKTKDQEKLFKMFGATENEQVTTKGIGFGLMISKLLVTEFEGEIDFDSVWKEGSTFFFTFQLGDFCPDDYSPPKIRNASTKLG